MTNEARMRAAFRDALALSAEAEVDGLTYRGIPEWDSVAHMQLIAALEETFDLMIDTADVLAMSSFEVAREILGKYGVQW